MSAGSKRLYCGHCKEFVCKTTYHQHKRLYYDKSNKRWSSEQVFAVGSKSTQAAFLSTLYSSSMDPTGTADLENKADFIEAACDHGPSQSPFETPVDDKGSGHHALTL